MTGPARRAFDVALPGAGETLLLRSLHLEGARSLRAWQGFRERVPDLVPYLSSGRPGRKALAPLVYDAVREKELGLRPPERTYLKSAFLRERHRGRRYRAILEEALDALADADVDCAPLKGAALGRILYREQGLRHSHDVELLVRREALDAAARALVESGDWTPAPELSGPRGEGLAHRSGLPLLLWWDPFRSPHVDAPVEDLWERSTRDPGSATSTRRLAASDHLLLVLANAAYSRARESLLWACDGVRIVGSGDVSWECFVSVASASGLRIPAFRMVNFLARELDAPVPAEAIEDLERRSRRVDAVERDAALRAARVGPGGVGALMRSGLGLSDRARLLWWTLFPSPAYVRRLADEEGRGAPLPVLYARRLGRWTGTALERAVRRTRRRRGSTEIAREVET